MNKVIIIVSEGRVDRVFTHYPSDVEIEVIDLDTNIPKEYDKARERADGYYYSPDYLPIY